MPKSGWTDGGGLARLYCTHPGSCCPIVQCIKLSCIWLDVQRWMKGYMTWARKGCFRCWHIARKRKKRYIKHLKQSKLPMRSPVLRGHFFLSCHRRFQTNCTSFKRSPVLENHFFFVTKVTSLYRFNYIN